MTFSPVLLGFFGVFASIVLEWAAGDCDKMWILHLSLLGEPRLTAPCGRVLAMPGPKAMAVLASLASADGMRMSRAAMAGRVWGDAASSPAARHALRQCLVRLRGQLGDAARILGADDGAVWLEADLVAVDLDEIRDAMQAGDATAIVAQSGAVRGRFCAGLDIGAPDFDVWLRARQGEHDRLCAELHGRAAAILAERDGEAAVAAARRRIEAEPFQDDAHAALIALLCAQGRRQAAADAHEACHLLFRDELGVAPAPDVDAALATPVPALPSRGPAALTGPGPPPPPARHRVAAAFFAGLAAAVLLLEIPASRQGAPAPAAPQREVPLWVGAAAASPARGGMDAAEFGYRSSSLEENGDDGDDDGGGDGRETDYAMLYPPGC